MYQSEPTRVNHSAKGVSYQSSYTQVRDRSNTLSVMDLHVGNKISGSVYDYVICESCGDYSYLAAVEMRGALGEIQSDGYVEICECSRLQGDRVEVIEQLNVGGKELYVVVSDRKPSVDLAQDIGNDYETERTVRQELIAHSKTEVTNTPYKGEVSNGKAHGYGKMFFPDHTVYDGQWVRGQMCGKGTMIWPDGTKYVGEWKASKRTGKGTIYYPDGSSYSGDFKDGQRHGYGVLTNTYGERFEGQFIGDKPTDHGTYYAKNGRKRNVKGGTVFMKYVNLIWDKSWRLLASLACFALAVLTTIYLIDWLSNGRGGVVRVGAFIAPFYLLWYGIKLLINFFSYIESETEI